MYYLVLGALVVCSLFEVFNIRPPKKLFILIYVIMTLMAIFRFGQLGDYFDYYYLYTQNPLLMRDVLFILYALIFRLFDANYEVFIGATEIICMGLAFPFFYKTCKGNFISLLAFYCYTYMVCPMSALRQAVCLSLLLCSYTLLTEHRKKAFYAMVAVGTFIHLSFFVVLIIGLFYDRAYFNEGWILYVVLFATFLFFVGTDLTAGIRGSMENRSVSEVAENSLDHVVQIVLRLLILLPLLFVYPDYGSDGYYAKAICIIGYVLYCLLASNILVAGRMEYFFRTFICLFIAYMSEQERSFYRNVVLYSFILLHSALFFKNISGFIAQGNYNVDVTILNFPYISIFDKEEIDEYTGIDTYGYSEYD